MALQIWSWIFIVLIMLVQPGYAYVGHNGGLARRALENIFLRDLSESQIKTKNIYIALAITASVVLLVGLLGLFIAIQRSTRQVKVAEPESGMVAPRPSWWMVEGKDEKMDWWRLSHRLETASIQTAADPVEGGRIARLKAALQRQATKKQGPIIPMHHSNSPSPTGSLGLPIQPIPEVPPQRHDDLERGYRAPIYSVESPPQVPLIYVGSKPLKRSPASPPRAIVTVGHRGTIVRAGGRSGPPRSPAGRRRDWAQRHSFRNPFLPLKTPVSPLKISAPITLPYVDPTNPKLTYGSGLLTPRAAPSPPAESFDGPPVLSKIRRVMPPAPLNLDNRSPLSAARLRIGFPSPVRPFHFPSNAF